MINWQAIGSWFAKASLMLDPYERQARLSPALLCLVPLAVQCLALYPDQVLTLKGLAGLATGVGLMYLLADHARSQGRKREPQLYRDWGGKPSIQVLRHRDEKFDPVSKARYHELLGKKLKTPLPTKAEEAADPAAADAAYAAASSWLVENTRDKKKFNLLVRDNITYGYRRNGHGVRRAGLAICAAVLAWVALRGGPAVWGERLAAGATPETLFSAGEVATIGVALFMSYIWIANFSAGRVRDAAFCYARRLVLSCEILPARAAAKPKGTEEATPAK